MNVKLTNFGNSGSYWFVEKGEKEFNSFYMNKHVGGRTDVWMDEPTNVSSMWSVP